MRTEKPTKCFVPLQKLRVRLTICFLCILIFVILAILRFGFEGWSLALIASIPDLRILFTFKRNPTFFHRFRS